MSNLWFLIGREVGISREEKKLQRERGTEESAKVKNAFVFLYFFCFAQIGRKKNNKHFANSGEWSTSRKLGLRLVKFADLDEVFPHCRPWSSLLGHSGERERAVIYSYWRGS